MESNLEGKAVPLTVPDPAEWPRCCSAASDCLALLCSRCSKWMNRLIRVQGHSFSMFMSAVLIPLLRDLGQSVSLLNTSNQNKKQ